MTTEEIRVGISACLLGQSVRYDGGHKEDAYLTRTLAPLVRFVPVCPEVEIGMGTPREAVRLVRAPDGARMVGVKSARDWTDPMRSYARRKAKELEALELCGFILKKDSPSCGVERVRIYDGNGVPSRTGRGLFAEALIERHPQLPVEEEGRLRDPRLRENFFERVFAYRRLRDLFSGRWRRGQLVEFHTREKLLLLAHDPVGYRRLGRLVAAAKERERVELAREYGRELMGAMARLSTVKKHRNVLQHAAGHLKKLLGADEKAELQAVIADFAAGVVPLVVPITLLRHHVRRHAVAYLAGQTYLDPHPKELMLRNHV